VSPSAIALGVILAIVALGSAIGFYAGARRKMDLEQWTVAGRGFGGVLMWLLMAGEVYTTFSFLGASGWAYSRGAPVLYILAYITLAYVVSFFILPPIWELGRRHQLQTQSDFFAWRYRGKYLVAAVSLVGIAFMIPYLELQITGFGIIVEVASFDSVSRNTAMIVAVILLAGFVLASGLRAVAWVSVLKDILMLIAAVSVGIGIPYKYFGGIGPMFTALIQAKPTHFVMPGATANLGHGWYISTVLLTGFGIYMWPHSFGAAFSAKSAATLRRNAVVMPLYTLSLTFMLFVGFAAILVIPDLRDGDLSLLAMVRKTFPPWFLGVIGGAGALTAMVPAAILILSSATVFAKNLFRPLFAPGMNDHQVGRVARMMVIVISAIALYLSIHGSSTLVSLLLLGYAGITQLFPGVVLGLFWNRVTMPGVFVGLAVGVISMASLFATHHDPFLGVSAGFLGLCANFALAITISLLTPSVSFNSSTACNK
jgi:SSS family solute:Na+ symporter